MNFYQKIVFLITLAIIGITLAIAFVCFDLPFSNIFITELTAILAGEIILGTIFIHLLKSSDRMLPYSMAVSAIGVLYLLFVLMMIYPAWHGMQLKYFILTHAIGLVIAGIAYGVFILGEHNIVEQEKVDGLPLQNKKSFFLQMKNIHESAKLSFPGEADLLRESEKMTDRLRFASDSRNGMSSIDQDIQSILAAMKSTVSEVDIAEYKKQLEHLKLLYHTREEQAKLN